MPPTCGSAAALGRGPPNGFCASSGMHGAVEHQDGGKRRHADQRWPRAACDREFGVTGNPP